jgi:DNA-binding response OmpR family regulator
MPQVGGFEVLEWMRSQDRFQDVAIYILSSAPRHEDQKIAIRLGANGFWIKKTNFSELLELVRRLGNFALPNNSRTSVTIPI